VVWCGTNRGTVSRVATLLSARTLLLLCALVSWSCYVHCLPGCLYRSPCYPHAFHTTTPAIHAPTRLQNRNRRLMVLRRFIVWMPHVDNLLSLSPPLPYSFRLPIPLCTRTRWLWWVYRPSAKMREAVLDLMDDSDDDFRCDITVSLSQFYF